MAFGVTHTACRRCGFDFSVVNGPGVGPGIGSDAGSKTYLSELSLQLITGMEFSASHDGVLILCPNPNPPALDVRWTKTEHCLDSGGVKKEVSRAFQTRQVGQDRDYFS